MINLFYERTTPLAKSFIYSGITVPSIYTLFANLQDIITAIPANERYNLHYTLCNCTTSGGRDFAHQDVVLFDIDDIGADTLADASQLQKYIDAFFIPILQRNRPYTAISVSGNGLHFLIPHKKISDPIFFTENRHIYKKICEKIADSLSKAGLTGKVDSAVFAKNHLARLPETKNIKEKDGLPFEVNSFIVKNFENFNNSQEDLLCLSTISEKLFEKTRINQDSHQESQCTDVSLIKFKSDTIDIMTIFDKQEGCRFLAEYRDAAHLSSEPDWRAMLSVCFFISEELCHELSSKHPDYTPAKTDMKLAYIRNLTGPWSCDAVSQYTDINYCNSCKHRGKIKNPLQIKSNSFFPTKDSGFYFIKKQKNGNIKKIPDIEGAVRFFEKNFCYKTDELTGDIYVWNNFVYTRFPDLRLESWFYELFNPIPTSAVVHESIKLLKARNLVTRDFFEPKNLFSFGEKVWDIQSNSWLDASPEMGITSILSFKADDSRSTHCPNFMEFLNSIFQNDQKLINLAIDYFAYCISDIDPRLVEKFVIFLGSGSNGKSVLLDVLKWLVGETNFSSLSLDAMQKAENLYELIDKKINICDEIDKTTELNPALLKNIVSGGEVLIKKLYAQPFKYRLKTKFIFSANSMPYIPDDSYGMRRRLIILPFKNVFSDDPNHNASYGSKVADKGIRDRIRAELPQIFNLLLERIDVLKKTLSFDIPEESRHEINDFVDLSDSFHYFISYFCKKDDSCPKIKLTAFYKRYQNICKEYGMKSMSCPAFIKRIKNNFPAKIFIKDIHGLKAEYISGFKVVDDDEITDF
ncbi:MAG: phage/plasmid primase, P4 family [Patescibacteria group bacterium]|nr:phage/plasmid primase, P4 family [Patescibacteria group bacterium]